MNFLFYAMIILLIVMTINNARRLKSFGNERGFVEVYSKVLDSSENAKEELDKFIAENKIVNLNAKALIVRIYNSLMINEDYSEDLKNLNFGDLFMNNSQYNKELFTLNCDAFIWLSLIYSLAYQKDKKDLVKALNEKVQEYQNVLNKNLEYHLYLGYYKALEKEKDGDYTFLKDLINGEYSSYVYEKRLIGLYKREAALFLFLNDDLDDEFWKQDLKHFYETKIGKHLIKNLKLEDKVSNIEAPEAVSADGE